MQADAVFAAVERRPGEDQVAQCRSALGRGHVGQRELPDPEHERRNTLHAGNRHGMDSFAGEVWVVTDADENALSIHVAQEKQGKVILPVL